MTNHKGTRSILPNSGPQVLNFNEGGFTVQWHEDRDAHTLYHEGVPIVSKHNGHSCTCLAKRVIAARQPGSSAYVRKSAFDQFAYIKACGGKQHVSEDQFAQLLAL